ncbi:MAG TPA: hypothetical protein VMN39_09410 [Longimicrobiaceae bacterium]|nr:hypothetical protein [Longimicrobiaceae bacterium]
MVDDFLGGFVGFLALLGGVALALAFFRSMGRVVLGAAEEAAAAGLADASARRGDLTGLSEAREARHEARAARRRSVLVSGAFAMWIVVPLALGGVREAWALAAPLWLLPAAGPRPSQPEHRHPEARDR